MELSYYPLTMEALDQADAEALCLFVSEDERPLIGLSGLVDWRLSGRLSRMIRAGLVIGADGEALLTPPGMRLAFKKLFLFGLGSARSDAELAAKLSDALRRLAKAGVKDAALQLPARLAPDVGVRTLKDGDVTLLRALVFTPEPGKLVTSLSSSGAPAVERRVVKVPSPPKASAPPRVRQRPTPAGSHPVAPPPAEPQEAEAADPPPALRPPPPKPQRYVPPPPKDPDPKKKRR